MLSGQVSDAEILLLQKLDSVKKAPSISSYFADLYLETTVRAVHFTQSKNNKSTTEFMRRMEISFAELFLHSAESFRVGNKVSPEWKSYYAASSLKPIQYQLLGINAHINGDIWKALVNEFSNGEIRNYRKAYHQFGKELTAQYKSFYDRSVISNPKLHLLDQASLGFSKWYGTWMLKKWRKRQLRMAYLYQTDKKRFDQKSKKLNRKMELINQLILTHL